MVDVSLHTGSQEDPDARSCFIQSRYVSNWLAERTVGLYAKADRKLLTELSELCGMVALLRIYDAENFPNMKGEMYKEADFRDFAKAQEKLDRLLNNTTVKTITITYH